MNVAVAPKSLRDAACDCCVHCGDPAAGGRRFCCAGCAAAYETIQGLGLAAYYDRRALDPAARAPRPESAERWDLACAITTDRQGRRELTLAVDGVQCGACVWLIEQVLARRSAFETARVNMTTRRLRLVWRGDPAQAVRAVAEVEGLGFRLIPFQASALTAAQDREARALMRALAVAGFAAANVMLSSIGVWAGFAQGMGPATRDLLHWASALVAMPAIIYAGMPFFRSAAAALRHRRTNMDVPISVGVILVTAMSLAEAVRGGAHVYFDSAISLLFFLLIGRVLDRRARGLARATAEQLLALQCTDVTLSGADGTSVRVPSQSVTEGARILVAAGERVGVDGVVEAGRSLVDTSLVTGEHLPVQAGPGTAVFAGTVNLGDALTVRATAVGTGTLLAECGRLIEAAEARRSRFVVLADRVARRYAPAVHAAAALTFLWWWGIAGAPAGDALLTACAVLIITCPCALALAVPAVQVIATSGLFRRGVLVKSGTALERLAEIDTIVFDKTGTLTEPRLALVEMPALDPSALAVAAGMAGASRHPLARSLVAAARVVVGAEGVREIAGQGLECGAMRLGRRAFAGDMAAPDLGMPELWLSRPGCAPVCFRFEERLRSDAVETVGRLRALGFEVHVLSGDRPAPVRRIAEALGIKRWRAECRPAEKVAEVEALRDRGRRVLMVGDGLNDSPSLAAAYVSMSPSSAADLSQTVADVVFQGVRLGPVLDALLTAQRARSVMRQNIGFAIAYNLVMVSLAVCGLVTPWIAALAMSTSSLVVMGNSFRARGAAT